MSSPIHISGFLVHTKVEVLDESLRGKLRLYALLAPHIAVMARQLRLVF